MRILGLLLFLLLSSNAALAADWQLASSLQNTHRASDSERAALVDMLHDSLVVPSVENDDPILIHEGDLRIAGNFDNDIALVVRGDFTVDGMYDDNRSNTGLLIVLGDMQVRDVYSRGAMHVQGDLDASGLVMTVGTTFGFEVGGTLDALALLVSYKNVDYTAGDIGVEWGDEREEADIAAALRTFEPDLFTRPGHLLLDDDQGVYLLQPDEEIARKRLTAAESVFRRVPANDSVLQWADAAIDSFTSTNELGALIGKDPLVDQLIAARATLPKHLAERLLAGGDAIVLAWLARSAPEVVLGAGSKAMTPDGAAALAERPETGEDDLLRIATHADPQVRKALAKRAELSKALINRLAADTDANVRAAVIGAYFNALELDPAVLEARLGDEAQSVKDALVGARLDATQALGLIPSLSERGLRHFAFLLLEQARGARPTALDATGIVAVADAVLARRQIDASTHAFMSLPATMQLERLEVLANANALDLVQILGRSSNPDLLLRIVAMFDAAGTPLPPELARNPNVPEVLQLDILSRAAKAARKMDGFRSNTPEELLRYLLGNDAVTDETLLAATDLALLRGIDLKEGMQSALFDHRNLPPAAITKLEHELGDNLLWDLKLIRQRRATGAQVDRAMRRLYVRRREVINELRRIEAKQVADYFAALATAKNVELREVAAWNIATPASALVALIDDPESSVAALAARHPSLPHEARLRLARRTQPTAYASLVLNTAQWDTLATTLPTREARIAAMAQAARMRERQGQ